jgi:antitoxin component YwqK of YwqJK toxin-antitoxin module
MKYLFAFFALPLFCFPQNKTNEPYKKLKDGPDTTFYAFGKIFETCFIKNGLLDGECRQYYKDGTLFNTILYKDGKFNGEQYFYNKNGSVDSHWIFVEDTLKVFDFYYYFRNGKVKTFESDTVLHDTLFVKSMKSYPFRTMVNMQAVMKRMNFHGIQKNYWKNGKLAFVGYMVNNKFEGEETSWFDDGSLYYKGYYKDNKKDGEFIYYNFDGTVMKKEVWKEGTCIETIRMNQ